MKIWHSKLLKLFPISLHFPTLHFLRNMQASLGICLAGIAPSTAIYDNDSVKNNQFMIGKKEAENETGTEATATTTETASLGCLPPPPTLPLPGCLPALVGWFDSS